MVSLHVNNVIGLYYVYIGFSFSISFQTILHKPTTSLVSTTQIQMRKNTYYSGLQILPLKAPMRKLMHNYNSRVLIKLPPFMQQGTSKHVYVKVEIL